MIFLKVSVLYNFQLHIGSKFLCLEPGPLGNCSPSKALRQLWEKKQKYLIRTNTSQLAVFDDSKIFAATLFIIFREIAQLHGKIFDPVLPLAPKATWLVFRANWSYIFRACFLPVM